MQWNKHLLMKLTRIMGIYLLLIICLLGACDKDDNTEATLCDGSNLSAMEVVAVAAKTETDPIEADITADAADDPALWIHPTDPSRSILYGSNKTGGIAAYDLTGSEIMYAPVGRINNIDVAYNIQLQNETIDIIGATNRSDNALDLYQIDPASGELTFILEAKVISAVDDVYGFCFYHSPHTGINYAILCGLNGFIEQYEIVEGGAKLTLKLARTFPIGSQTEGLVADHKLGLLYIAEEAAGIWVVSAEPDDFTLTPIDLSSEQNNPNIAFDLEGLTIYYTDSEEGYLIASSQGNSTFAVYERQVGNCYLGSFRIKDGTVDGVSTTDGIEVINLRLGTAFPNGLFVCQDDRNLLGGTRIPQNFKMTDLGALAEAFDPPLQLNIRFNPRTLFD